MDRNRQRCRIVQNGKWRLPYLSRLNYSNRYNQGPDNQISTVFNFLDINNFLLRSGRLLK